MIPAAELDDDRLVELYRRARQWGLLRRRQRGRRAPSPIGPRSPEAGIHPVTLYGGLAVHAAQRNDRAEASEWIRRGRQAESLRATPRTLVWELADLQVSTLSTGPRSGSPPSPSCSSAITATRTPPTPCSTAWWRWGWSGPWSIPKRPDQVLLDMGILDQLIAQYGPRVTTAAGDRGAAAERIWTPDSARGGAAIWTPGSDAAPSRAPDRKGPASSSRDSERRPGEIGARRRTLSARKERPDVLDVAGRIINGTNT